MKNFASAIIVSGLVAYGSVAFAQPMPDAPSTEPKGQHSEMQPMQTMDSAPVDSDSSKPSKAAPSDQAAPSSDQ